jgi:hypothetical protein
VANITADSFNVDLRQKIAGVLVDGYGGTLLSSPIVRDTGTNLYPLVDDSQWDDLRLDALAARVHQIGTIPALTEVNATDLISTALFDQYLTLAEQIVLDSGSVAVGQYQDVVPTNLVNPTLPLSFGKTAYHRTTVTFATAAAANQFFNSGGGFLVRFEFTPTLTGPAGAQSRVFQSLSSEMGQRFFGKTQWTASTTNYVNWTNPVISADSAYGGNYLRFRSSINTSNHLLATQLTFEILLESAYTTFGPSGSGAGSISYGDQVGGFAAIDILQRRSYINNPSPVTTEFWNYDANWVVQGQPITYP